MIDNRPDRNLHRFFPATVFPMAGIVLAAALLPVVGCSAPSAPPVPNAAAGSVPEDYIIGAGDTLSVFVYRNPDLSEAGVAVRPDHMTLLDVMIATKGLTKYASGNRATIVRLTATGGQESLNDPLGDLVKDGDISQNTGVKPGDTLIIPQAWF